MYEYLKQRDKAIADETAKGGRYFSLSPTRVCLSQVVFPLIEQHIQGCCLDAGAGRMAYAFKLKQHASEYISMDVTCRTGMNVSGSVLSLPWRNSVFDSIFCSQVLEHVPEPEQALNEFYRCLNPGGCLIVTVPHLSYLHNEPNDFFRFTRHGLRHLLQKAGFSEIKIIPAGGLISFIGHIPSVIVKTIFQPIPLLGKGVISLNTFYARIIAWIDQRVEKRKIYALNYVAVAIKPKDQL